MHDEFNKFDFCASPAIDAGAETISEKHHNWTCRLRVWGVDHSRTAAYIGIKVWDSDVLVESGKASVLMKDESGIRDERGR